MTENSEIHLDVRPVVQRGESPLPHILSALEDAAHGQPLRLLVPFEPTPLYAFLGERGYTHQAKELPDGTWEIRFSQSGDADQPGEQSLDLRDLDPPEPMRRTLAALPGLGRHETLTVLTRFRPVHLIDQLPSRGFDSDSDEIEPECWETRIWRRLLDENLEPSQLP